MDLTDRSVAIRNDPSDPCTINRGEFHANITAGPALWRANVGEAAGLHLYGGADVGAWNWREYGDIQRDQRADVAPAALCEPGAIDMGGRGIEDVSADPR